MSGAMGMSELLIVLVTGALMAALLIWPATRICAKAGYSPWLGIAIIVPFANILLLWYLALARWPAHGTSTRES